MFMFKAEGLIGLIGLSMGLWVLVGKCYVILYLDELMFVVLFFRVWMRLVVLELWGVVVWFMIT